MSSDSLAPVIRKTTASIVADRIRTAIMDGTLAPGAQLTETGLASRLGVSRGPLREAMQRLVQQGLLRSEPHRGLFVIELTQSDVSDIYLARAAVEGAAVQRIIALGESTTQEAREKLSTIVHRMEVAATKSQSGILMALDLDFHECLVSGSGSQRLARIMDSLMVETKLCLRDLVPRYENPEELAAEHGALLKAIERGAITEALASLQDHMMDALRRLAP